LMGKEFADPVTGRGADGYNAIQIGAGGAKLKNTTIAERGHLNAVFTKAGLPGLPEGWNKQNQKGVSYGPDDYPNLYDVNSMYSVPDISVEFRVDYAVTEECKTGDVISAMQFVPGQMIDVRGLSKGKGFQGGMKRHNFGGMPASHGVSRTHRHIGSTGQCQDPGKVWKGRKMPGHMGTDNKTIQNLRVLKIDRGRNLIYVMGGVPGQNGNWLELRDSKRKPFIGVGGGGKTMNDPSGYDTSLLESPVERHVPFPIWKQEEGIDGSGIEGITVEWIQKSDPYKSDPAA
jgi:ribosomal protein L3